MRIISRRRGFGAVALAAALGAAGCGRAAPPVPPVESSPAGPMLFCAYGGVGLVPDPLPEGYETEFAAIAIRLDNPGEALDGVTVLDGALLDEAGAVVGTLRRVDHFVVLPEPEAPGPTMGIFAVHLNPEGNPFDGRLPSGTTFLRVRFSLDRSPYEVPATCRLEIGGVGPAPLVLEGEVAGSWPT